MKATEFKNLNGLVLAGGESSRMGFDKAFLNFHGEPQVNWLHTLLQSFCDRVFVSGSPTKIQGQFEFIEDHYVTGGPLNGILSAVRLHPIASWLVVPVDMPRIDGEALTYLLNHRNKTKPATCFLNPTDNTIEPLPFILEPSAYPLLQQRFQQGNESLNSFLKDEGAQAVLVNHSEWLKNVNFPQQV